MSGKGESVSRSLCECMRGCSGNATVVQWALVGSIRPGSLAHFHRLFPQLVHAGEQTGGATRALEAYVGADNCVIVYARFSDAVAALAHVTGDNSKDGRAGANPDTHVVAAGGGSGGRRMAAPSYLDRFDGCVELKGPALRVCGARTDRVCEAMSSSLAVVACASLAGFTRQVTDTGLEVMWTTLATLRSSMADEFSQLCIEMVGAARSREGGTQLFEVFASADGQVQMFERFDSSAAALEHLSFFDCDFAHRWDSCVEACSPLRVCGAADEALMAAVAARGGVRLPRLGGFAHI